MDGIERIYDAGKTRLLFEGQCAILTNMTQGGNAVSENPKSFDEFDVKELRRIAVEDFAIDVKPNDNKKTVLAAFVEVGVDFDDYARLKGWTVEEPASEPVAVTEEVTTMAEPVNIVTQQEITTSTQDKYLLKMERPNLVYETAGYRFTKEHPYALVDAAAADFILRKEKGFRMAFPTELEEFYS